MSRDKKRARMRSIKGRTVQLDRAGVRVIQRRDGAVVEMRDGYRPRVLSKAEVEALKLAEERKKEQDENPFATMTKASSMSPTDA